MIKFFRAIRKILIKQGKIASTVNCAIGEIALVVIGIHFAH
jgi:hypothetical protein